MTISHGRSDSVIDFLNHNEELKQKQMVILYLKWMIRMPKLIYVFSYAYNKFISLLFLKKGYATQIYFFFSKIY